MIADPGNRWENQLRGMKDAQNLVCSAGTGLRAMEIHGIASLVVSIQPRSHNKMEWDQEELLFDPF